MCLVDPQAWAGSLLSPGRRGGSALTLGLQILNALARDRVIDLGARQRRERLLGLAPDLLAAMLGLCRCHLGLTGGGLGHSRVLGLDHLKRGLQPGQPAGWCADLTRRLDTRQHVSVGRGERLILGRQRHQLCDLAPNPVRVAIARP